MVNSAHPLAVDPRAVRLLEHTLLRTEELLGAGSSSLDGGVVTSGGGHCAWSRHGVTGPAGRLARAGRFSTLADRLR
jgi:hypothetical protein